MMYKSTCLKVVTLLISCINFVHAMDIDRKSVFIPTRMGNILLHHDGKQFNVRKDSQTFPIQSCFVDKDLRGISTDTLSKMLVLGAYFSINQVGKGSYSLKLNGRLNGGGPIFGWAAYCATKAICYGVALAGAGAAVAATGGAIGAVGGAVLGILGASATAGTSAVAGTVAGAVTAIEGFSMAVGAIITALPTP